MSSLDEIVHVVRAKPAPDGVAPKIIAVDGPGGAGKSTLASHIADRLGGAPVLRTDDFASWDNPVDWWPRLIAEALEPLSRNRAARFRRTDWEGADRELWTLVEPAEYLVLEGDRKSVV